MMAYRIAEVVPEVVMFEGQFKADVISIHQGLSKAFGDFGSVPMESIADAIAIRFLDRKKREFAAGVFAGLYHYASCVMNHDSDDEAIASYKKEILALVNR